MNQILQKWNQGLEKTRKNTFSKISSLLGKNEITSDTWEKLEEALIQADVGIHGSTEILDLLKQTAKQEGFTHASDLMTALKDALLLQFQSYPHLDFHTKPAVILIVGVNGSGKTTTIAKLGYRFMHDGKSVLFGASDTFRAGAIEQLSIWGSRMGIPVILGQVNGDPAAVAYDTIQAAISRKLDIVLIDTAGRLHTRTNLMDELKKVKRVAGKALPGAPHAVWLVMDATTGQNAIHQAKAFNDAVDVDGVILTKLDTSARGGMALAIQKDLHLPILFAGLGEKLEDLQLFNPVAFVNGIIDQNSLETKY